jgi:hypothetical protein
MKAKPPTFLCRFQRRDVDGSTYYISTLGNSRLLIQIENGEPVLYLGPQLEVKKISLQDQLRGANGSRLDLEAVAKLK